MKKLQDIIEQDNNNEVVIEQPVNQIPYKFRFVFIDPEDENTLGVLI